MVEQTIDLPRDIPVTFCDCGQENAFYSYDNKSITICYEFIENGLKRLDKRFDGYKEEKIGGVAISVLGHELGHALVDQKSIPITGKEESAVDEFSLAWSLKKMPSLYVPLFFGVLNWYCLWYDSTYGMNLNSQWNRIKKYKSTFADVHAPDLVRYYDLFSIFCGFDLNRAKNAGYIAGDELLKGWKLPANRSLYSESDYSKSVDVWSHLLTPKRKAVESNSNVNSTSNTNVAAFQQSLNELGKAIEQNERIKAEAKREKRQSMISEFKNKGYRIMSMTTALGDIYTDSKCFVFPTANLKNRQIEGIVEIDTRINKDGQVIAQRIIYSDVKRSVENDCINYLSQNTFTAKCENIEGFTDTKIIFHFK